MLVARNWSYRLIASISESRWQFRSPLCFILRYAGKQNQVGQAFKTANSIVLYRDKPLHSLSKNEIIAVLVLGFGRRGLVRRVRRRLRSLKISPWKSNMAPCLFRRQLEYLWEVKNTCCWSWTFQGAKAVAWHADDPEFTSTWRSQRVVWYADYPDIQKLP